MIEKDYLFAFYDQLKKVAIVSFRNYMTAESLQEARHWLDRLASQVALNGVLCEVRGLRKITELAPFYQPEEKLPFVFLILHPYQAAAIQSLCPSGNYKILSNYQEAFQSFPDALAPTSLPSAYNGAGVSLTYDFEKNIQNTIYYGIVNTVVTGEAYAAMNSNIARTGVAVVRGAIFDFRHVIDFDNSNLNTVRRTSSSMASNNDLSHIAAPLIVATTFQESMVRVAMKVTAKEERKQIVHSYAEALDFVEAFQAKRAAKEASS